jgi:hypothetical protein
MAGPGLLTNIDTTYPDAGDASVPLHQRDHDKVHTTINVIDKDTLPPTPVMLAGVVANNQTGTTYTLVLADAGKVVELNNVAAISLLVPTNASVAFPIGTVVEIWNQGSGQTTVSATTPGTTTIRSPNGRTAMGFQYGSATLRKRATDEWCLEGNLA